MIDSTPPKGSPATTIPFHSVAGLQDKGGFSNPSKDYLASIQALRARIEQKRIDEQVVKENAARQAEEQAQIEREAIEASQLQPTVNQVPLYTSSPIQSDDYYVNWIIQHESGGNPYAVNASSGACGLFQRYPCSVPLGDVATQMADGLAYIASRYGSAYNAYLYWVQNGNY